MYLKIKRKYLLKIKNIPLLIKIKERNIIKTIILKIKIKSQKQERPMWIIIKKK